ncbi:hypothetical protein [Lysobacter antibioticus]|uniref:hypothetical protein n=1 Tax=Lysobacter antibioticus TaxID=84531 RepID=UPI00118758F2|nr:hypothetical protein [Lysobacter antibioticus]
MSSSAMDQNRVLAMLPVLAGFIAIPFLLDRLQNLAGAAVRNLRASSARGSPRFASAMLDSAARNTSINGTVPCAATIAYGL